MFAEYPEWVILCVKRRCRWGNNIKLYLEELLFEGVNSKTFGEYFD
jgi:hypothetical protein